MTSVVRIRWIPLLVASLVVLSPFAIAQDWKTYSYPADGFSVSAPSSPVASTQNVTNADGTVEMHNYLVDVGSAALYASVAEDASLLKKNTEEALKGAEKGAVDNVHGRLVSDKRIVLGDYPGIEVEVENDTAHFTARIYIVRSTLYLMLVVTGLGKPYPDAQRFLDSFHLIQRTSS
jgi:hypothetical protein